MGHRTLDLRIGIPSDDNSGLFNKKSVLQTKYRPLFLKKQTASPENTDQNLKCHSAEHKTERRDTMLNTIVQGVYFDIITVESNSIYQTFLNLHKRV